MVDEYHKPENERIPLPRPSKEYINDLEYIAKHYHELKNIKEKEVSRSISPIESARPERPSLENFKLVEGGLAECPNCNRTFFPDRLMVHLKSCKPGKPLMPKKKRLNMRWQSPKQKDTHKSNLRMPLLGKGNLMLLYL